VTRSQRGTWCTLAAVLLACAGLARWEEGRVDAARHDASELAARLDAARHAIASAPATAQARAVLRARLRRLREGRDAIAGFVAGAARVAARRGTSIEQVTVAPPVRASLATAAAASVPSAEATALDLTFDGRYAEVLAMLRDLSSAGGPARVQLTTLARANGARPSARSTLEAGVHVTLVGLDDMTVSDAPLTPSATAPSAFERSASEPSIRPRRDPFAAPDAVPPNVTTASVSLANANAAGLNAGPANLPAGTIVTAPRPPFGAPAVVPPGGLPGAPGTPFLSAPPDPYAARAESSGIRVDAIVTGAHPVALLREGGADRIVAVGDTVGAARITAIASGGVQLSSGVALTLAPRRQGDR